MLAFILRRIVVMIPTLFAISFVSFFLIQLPPGDIFSTQAAEQAVTGGGISSDQLDLLRQRYGLDQPFLVQYVQWIAGFPRGDFGYSFEWRVPVWGLVIDRIAYTVLLGFLSLVLMFVMAIPIGIYSSTHQYSLGDNVLSGISFLGLSIPGFVLALLWMYMGAIVLRIPVGGVIASDLENSPMSLTKLVSYFNHLWPPALILGLASTAQLTRIMRSGMLDVLSQQYITTARAKGLPEQKVINKYAVRPALNPIVSVMAMEIPKIISSSILIGQVMAVPTTGPLFLRSLQNQDMYLAGTFLLLIAVLQLFANLAADIALAWLDPRIVYT